MKPVPSGRQQEAKNELVLSFLSVRRALGVLGLTLPFLLLIAGWISGDGLQPSISEFYFTSEGDILVGVLSAIGVFLWSYRGFQKRPGEWLSDRVISRIAAMGALGVAFVPTRGPAIEPAPLVHRLIGAEASRALHYTSAGVFFVCLALFCLILFCRHEKKKPMSRRKIAENRIYRTCGWFIVAVIVAMGAYGLWYGRQPPQTQAMADGYSVLFWLESIGVVAFGLSWLTKGKVLSRLLERVSAS